MLILNDDKNFKRQLIPNSTSSKASRTIGPSSEADVAKNGLDKIRRILMTVADPVAAMKEIQAQASDDLIALQAFQWNDFHGMPGKIVSDIRWCFFLASI